ncbi:Ig-like domain-containing protein [Dietzia sp. 179-F 9C3 NHS]|uniref:Ig-like domain-containing protein n=1 Tax=Dietzia sp. 179-F 9C3 NHS TaxID=3374295 RepID=UPI00387A5738
METDYTVLCDAGRVPAGGAEFASVAGQYRGSETLGPTITVNRATVSEFFLAAPGALEVNTPTTLRVNTNAPNGSDVTFKVDGQTLPAKVADGKATVTWTPSTAGSKTVTAELAQTATHLGKSTQRTVSVAEQVVDSTVVIDAPDTAQVGVRSELTATVTPAGAGGTVTFKEEGKIIASADVPASGKVTIDWVPEVEGDRSIDAEFSGRAGVNGSAAIGAKVNVTPKPAEMQQSTTSLAQVGMVDLGDTVTLQATVDPAVGGTVKFYDGNTLLDEVPVGENGVATLAWEPTTEGERTIRAVFSGTETVISSQAATQAIVTSATDTPEPGESDDPGTPGGNSGSLGSLTGILGGGQGASGSLGSLGSLSNN